MSYVFTGYETKSKWLVDDRTMIDDAFMLQVSGKLFQSFLIMGCREIAVVTHGEKHAWG